MSQAVGVGASFDDGAVEGEPVDDRGAEPRVGEGFGPAGEGLVGSDGDRVVLLPLGEDLKQQFCSSAIQLHVAEFVDHEQVDATVTGDGSCEVLLVGGFDEFVDESGGERVFDTEPLLRGRRAEAYEQVALAGARVSDEAEGLTFADPVAGGEGVDGGGVDVRVRFELEVSEPLIPGKTGGFHSANRGAAVAVVALGQEQFGEESLIAQLLLLGRGGGFVDDGPDRREPESPAGLVDGRVGCFLRETAAPAEGSGDAGGRGHDAVPFCAAGMAVAGVVLSGRRSSWS